ncbi:hypothetical protein IWX90DRAFT_511436 [Phyllosticta citrichinensis]|uniref:Uncharacterized protein n=1 Tax=Phyllosticta citrichinensis TaxID=1130410 RepID=A0ABR1Y3U1_9PEZI
MFARAACRIPLRTILRAPAARQSPRIGARTFASLPTQTRPRLQSPQLTRVGRRNASRRPFIEGYKALWRDSPFQLVLVTAIIVGCMGIFAWLPFWYMQYQVKPYHNYPEEVAKKLRRAIYYSRRASFQPKEVIRYYREALALADELGMDPFSDEVLGIRIQMAGFFELKLSSHRSAIDMLELVKNDCYLWMDKLGDKHWTDGKRTRVLIRIMSIHTKLGELYSNQYVKDFNKAEENLQTAISIAIGEKMRRQRDGVKVGEGDWIGDDELGAEMEQLGHVYEASDRHFLAAPLFLQAIRLSPKDSCHTAILMNNLAISLAQTRPPSGPAYNSPVFEVTTTEPHQQKYINQAASAQKKYHDEQAANAAAVAATAQAMPSRAEQGRLWAQKAIELTANIKPPVRDEECDLACAVATHNLGEFAEMEGRIKEARKWYNEAKSLAKAIGFEEGVQNADEGVKRLKGRKDA